MLSVGVNSLWYCDSVSFEWCIWQVADGITAASQVQCNLHMLRVAI
jgi:hypothetical protein